MIINSITSIIFYNFYNKIYRTSIIEVLILVWTYAVYICYMAKTIMCMLELNQIQTENNKVLLAVILFFPEEMLQ